jgi:hypothetical protein
MVVRTRMVLCGVVFGIMSGTAFGAALTIPSNCTGWGVNFMPAEQAQKIGTDIKNGVSSAFLFRRDNLQEELVARDASGQVETHATWIDHIVVQDGEATLTVGGTVAGDKETAPGERRGVSVTGGTVYHITRDAVIDINAGMPHWMTLRPGGHIRYLVFKCPASGPDIRTLAIL